MDDETTSAGKQVQTRRRTILAGVLVSAAVWMCLAGCGSSLNPFRSPQEKLQGKLIGVWHDEAGISRLDFRADAKVTAELIAGVQTTVAVSLAGRNTQLPGTVLGRLKFEGNWRALDADRARLFLPVGLDHKPAEVLVCAANMDTSREVLSLDCPPFGVSRRAFRKPGSDTKSEGIKQAGEDPGLRAYGYEVVSGDIPGIMVGENLYVAMGSIQGGQLDIAQGFTIQKIGDELAPAVRIARGVEGETDGQLLLRAGSPLFVKALVRTKGGVELLTDSGRKKLAHPLVVESGEFMPFKLTGVRAAGQQEPSGGSIEFWAENAAF